MVEFLIPLTIFITAFSNLFKNENNIVRQAHADQLLLCRYIRIIHGMGFSNYLRTILGKDKSIVSRFWPLTLDWSLAKIIIVVLIHVNMFYFGRFIGLNRRDWKMVISSAVAGIALILMKDNMYWININTINEQYE